MKPLEGVKVCCLDKDGNKCVLRIQELINYILSNQYSMFSTVTTKKWMCRDDLYFDYAIVVDTNIGPFQKVTSEPAMVTYIRYRNEMKTVGAVLFISKSKEGVYYSDLDDKLYNDVQTAEYNNDIWYYNITKPCVLSGKNEVSMITRVIYNDVGSAVRDIFNVSKLKSAELWTGVPDSEDYIFVIGANNRNNPESALVKVDINGNMLFKE